MLLPLLSATLVTAFTALGILHVYWLGGGSLGITAAVPEKAGKPLFRPSKQATLLVALGLFGCAALVAVLVGWIPWPLSMRALRLLGLAVAALFLLRAIGDFKWVGFFKRERGTTFATLDTGLYSPLCLGLALGVLSLLLLRR
ncbi:membrane protein [Geothrix limicola]|uniref:Membrane protein n=1 Tax=Geothrix limicola TaxID=2927978 RepID=A0ABQ5QJZ3_9BACT|nr:DUF3995 domain-containing protein [Geothrix limicola]GLH74868.1 membrane protein [Geothrix limicola]